MKKTKLGFVSFIGLILFTLSTITPVFVTAASLPHAVVQQPVAECVNNMPQVSLKWSAPLGATSYSIYKNQLPLKDWRNLVQKQIQTTYVDQAVSEGVSYQYQIRVYFTATNSNYSNIVTVAIPTCPTATSTPPAPAPSTPPPTSASETIISAYITGYGWPDNTPAGGAISNGVIHSSAGGTGSYSDPITLAVGHSILNGVDILDYPAGTKFYIPALRRYFIVEDTCGGGDSPQNGPCHTGYQGNVWLDAWIGGQNQNSSSVLACEDTITGIHTVIKNPASNYVVVSGSILNTGCTGLFNETATII